jgi:flagellar biogenesis protein FliO
MEIYSQILAGALVLALLGATLWLLRRGAGIRLRIAGASRGKQSVMESRARLSLSPQHALHLVRVGDRAVLVAVHSNGCELLESRPWRDLERTKAPDREPEGDL